MTRTSAARAGSVWCQPARPPCQANEHRPPAGQLALALQAADEALEGLAVELTGDPPAE
jgi:hypothetical protein